MNVNFQYLYLQRIKDNQTQNDLTIIDLLDTVDIPKTNYILSTIIHDIDDKFNTKYLIYRIMGGMAGIWRDDNNNENDNNTLQLQIINFLEKYIHALKPIIRKINLTKKNYYYLIPKCTNKELYANYKAIKDNCYYNINYYNIGKSITYCGYFNEYENFINNYNILTLISCFKKISPYANTISSLIENEYNRQVNLISFYQFIGILRNMSVSIYHNKDLLSLIYEYTTPFLYERAS